MKRILRFLAQVIGSIMFSLLGGIPLFVACAFLAGTADGNEDFGLIASYFLGGLGFILGTTVVAAAGATIIQRISRQRGSFWKALLGSAAGLLAGGIVVYAMWNLGVSMRWECWVMAIASISALMAVGAVLGSGWKAKPAKVTGSLG